MKIQTDQLDVFLEHAPMSIGILDTQFRFLKISRAMERVHQLAPDTANGKAFTDVLPRLFTQVGALLKRVLTTGNSVEAEISGDFSNRGGNARNCLAVCFPAGEFEIGIMLLEAGKPAVAEALQDAYQQLKSVQADLTRHSVVSDVAHVLQGATSIQELYRVFGLSASKLFPGSAGALGVLNPLTSMAELAATWGDPSATDTPFPLDDCCALRKNETHIVNHPGLDPMCLHASGYRQYPQICVPMIVHSEVLGFLHVQNRTGATPGCALSEAEIRLVHALAEEVAWSLVNARIRESLRHQALRDPLTDLYNYRFLQESLGLELLRAGRRNSPVGFVMLDVDRFKPLNDIYGHAAGNALLCAVAATLQVSVRKSDVVCRYGGDEFSVVMPDTSLQDGAKRAEEWRSAFKNMSVKWQGGVLPQMTVSMGIATYPHCLTPAALFREADAALYSAKASGRDRIMTSRPPRHNHAV